MSNFLKLGIQYQEIIRRRIAKRDHVCSLSTSGLAVFHYWYVKCVHLEQHLFLRAGVVANAFALGRDTP